MLINGEKLAATFKGFDLVFSDALAAAPRHAERIAMMVSSSAREQAYPFVAAAPKVREWLGERQVHQLAAHDVAIKNRTHALTVELPRADLEDDQIGAYRGLFAELGHSVAEFKEELIFELLAEGFTRNGWDGVPFFPASHPITDATIGTVTTWSNSGGGSGTPWFLLDVSRPIRP
jgi:phage major head subunit gpT-like protein